jgi:hypothetical protein
MRSFCFAVLFSKLLELPIFAEDVFEGLINHIIRAYLQERSVLINHLRG